MNQNQVTPLPLVQERAGADIVGGVKSFLDYGLNIWERVEAAKNQSAASGNDLIRRDLNPELENGAAVQVDTAAADIQAQRDAGVTPAGEINKGLLYFSVGVLVFGLIAKSKGFK